MGNMQTKTVRQAINEALFEELERDDMVFIMGEDVAQYNGAYKITNGLLDRFGARRVIDTPISEHAFAGVAVGSAFMGLKPVVEFMTFNFAMQAIDHIINSAAKTLYMSGGQINSSLVFRGPNGAASRVAAQHSQCYASWYAHCPGLKVIVPYSAKDAKGLLKAAIRDPNPVIFLENEVLYGHSFTEDYDEEIIEIGKARVYQEGEHISMVAYGLMVDLALKAATKLKQEHGINVEVIDLRTIRPLDFETVRASVNKTGKLIVVEEGWPFASVASEICALAMEHCFDMLDAPVVRINGEDVPLPYAANLEKLALPSVEKIMEKTLKLYKNLI